MSYKSVVKLIYNTAGATASVRKWTNVQYSANYSGFFLACDEVTPMKKYAFSAVCSGAAAESTSYHITLIWNISEQGLVLVGLKEKKNQAFPERKDSKSSFYI